MASITSYCSSRYGTEESVRNKTYLFFRYLMVKMGRLSVVSHIFVMYMNVIYNVKRGFVIQPTL
jgi:hypothetical protein